MTWTLHPLPGDRVSAHVWDPRHAFTISRKDKDGQGHTVTVIPDFYQTSRTFSDRSAAKRWASELDKIFPEQRRHTAAMLEGTEPAW